MIAIDQILNNKYKITKVLGEGGTGTTFKCWDVQLKKEWALKAIDTLRPAYKAALSEDGTLPEIEILKSLDHPLAPRMVDRFDWGQYIFIVMDSIDGENLQSLLSKEGAQKQELVVSWMIDVCELLDYLHANGIIYRDMKPINLILSHDGKIRMVDFGNPTKIVRNGDYSDTEPIGTRGYAAPEQFKSYSDERSDIYTAGVTMYQLLTGESPVKRTFKMRPLRMSRAEIDRGIEVIIMKACSEKPKDRYQNMRQMIDALMNYKKIDELYVEKLKSKLRISKALGIAGLLMILSGALIFEGFYLRDVSVYKTLVGGRDLSGAIPGEENILKAIDIMPQAPDAYVLLSRSFAEDGFTDGELTRFDSLYERYEKAAFVKKEAYSDLNWEISQSFITYSHDIPFEKSLERLEKVSSHLEKASAAGANKASASSLFVFFRAFSSDSLSPLQAQAVIDSARSLLSSQTMIFGKGARQTIMVQDEMMLELLLKHKESFLRERPKEARALIELIEGKASSFEDSEEEKTVRDNLNKAKEAFGL